MLRTALRVLFRSAFVLTTAAVMSASCTRQAEGERCDREWAGADQDCASSDLTCTPCGALAEGAVDRCCRVDGTYSDPRCAPASFPTDRVCSSHHLGGTAGSGSTGTGGSGTAGSGTAGSGTAGSATAGSSTGATGGDTSSAGNAGEPNAGSGG